jgi:hypothetical protein
VLLYKFLIIIFMGLFENVIGYLGGIKPVEDNRQHAENGMGSDKIITALDEIQNMMTDVTILTPKIKSSLRSNISALLSQIEDGSTRDELIKYLRQLN